MIEEINENNISLSEEINKDKVTLSDDLISMIIGFIIPSFDIKSIKYFNGENNNSTLLIFNIFEYLKSLKLFHNTIPIKFLFNDVEEYREKKKLYNIYSNICNIFNSCKSFYSEKYKDSYIIFNKEYSKKYNDSKEFREEFSKKIDITKLLVYSNKLHEYHHIISRKKISCDILLNFEGEEKYLKERDSIPKIEFLKSTYTEVLTFMKLENTDVTKISKYDVLIQINLFLKKQKFYDNPEIFIGRYKTRFRLIGDLKILFDFIIQQMILKGDLENPEEFPEHIAYIDILKYLKYCFPQD
jgi:hypothetical protein